MQIFFVFLELCTPAQTASDQFSCCELSVGIVLPLSKIISPSPPVLIDLLPPSPSLFLECLTLIGNCNKQSLYSSASCHETRNLKVVNYLFCQNHSLATLRCYLIEGSFFWCRFELDFVSDAVSQYPRNRFEWHFEYNWDKYFQTNWKYLTQLQEQFCVMRRNFETHSADLSYFDIKSNPKQKLTLSAVIMSERNFLL